MEAEKEKEKISAYNEVIARINSDGQFFKALWIIFNIVLLTGFCICCFWLLQ